MSNPTPAKFTSRHRIKFSDLDPYKHMRTAAYPGYFVDHRMDALRVQAGWDLKTLEQLTFMAFVKRLEVDFIRPVVGDQEVSITSFVREFVGANAHVSCEMTDAAGRPLSHCHMVVTYVDKATGKPADWPKEARSPFLER